MYKTLASSLFIGKNLIFVPECHSTNTYAQQLCQQPNTPDGTLVITDNQTAGRGQRGNQWEAQPGMNLTFSLIVKPSFLLAKDQFYLNMAVSLGIYDHLKSRVNSEVRIKWPNDILIDGKKVCGILIESILQGSFISWSVLGIGLNVNQVVFSNERASSIKAFSGNDYILAEELEQLVVSLEKRYLQLKQGKTKLLLEDYYQHLYWLGEERKFSATGVEFIGKIMGVDETGRLRIQTQQREKVFALKEIEFLY